MEMLDIFSQITNAFLHTFIVFFFFSTFWENRYNKFINIVSFSIIAILLTGSLLLFSGSVLRFVLVYVLTLAVSVLFKLRWFHKFIYVSLIYAINSIIEVITEITISIVFVNSFILSNSKAMFIVGMIISKFVTFFVLLLIRLRRHSSLTLKINKKYWSLLVFPLATLMLSVLITMIFTTEPDQSPIVYFLVLATFTVLIISNMIVFDFIDSITTVYSYENKMILADEIIAHQANEYQTLINHSKDIMKIRHDHKNFCIGLINTLQSGDVDSAIKQISSEYDLCADASWEQGSIIQSLIAIKSKDAISKNIKFDFVYQGLKNINIMPTDLSIIIGNALDNAIEACERIKPDESREISISVIVKHNNIFINIVNTTADDVDINKLKESKKSFANEHGIGIISMRKIAEKYNGELHFDYHERIFTTTIMLRNVNT